MTRPQTYHGLESQKASRHGNVAVSGSLFFWPDEFFPMSKEQKRFGKYLMVIKDQCGVHNVVDLKTDDYLVARERANVVSRLPYEINPMPSGGMGLGYYDVRTRKIPNWDLSTEGVDCAIELIRLDATGGYGRLDYPPGTTYKDWK